MHRLVIKSPVCNKSLEEHMKKDKIFIGLVVLDAILLVLNLADSVLGSMLRAAFSLHSSDAASIAIIGGADGPTSVFIAGKVGTPTKGLLIALVVAVIVTVVYAAVKKKKDKVAE